MWFIIYIVISANLGPQFVYTPPFETEVDCEITKIKMASLIKNPQEQKMFCIKMQPELTS